MTATTPEENDTPATIEADEKPSSDSESMTESPATAEAVAAEEAITELPAITEPAAMEVEAPATKEPVAEEVAVLAESDHEATDAETIVEEAVVKEEVVAEETPLRPSNDPRKNPKPVGQIQIESVSHETSTSRPLDTTEAAQVTVQPSDHVRPANDPRAKQAKKPTPAEVSTDKLAERELDIQQSESTVQEEQN